MIHSKNDKLAFTTMTKEKKILSCFSLLSCQENDLHFLRCKGAPPILADVSRSKISLEMRSVMMQKVWKHPQDVKQCIR